MDFWSAIVSAVLGGILLSVLGFMLKLNREVGEVKQQHESSCKSGQPCSNHQEFAANLNREVGEIKQDLHNHCTFATCPFHKDLADKVEGLDGSVRDIYEDREIEIRVKEELDKRGSVAQKQI